jgi:hypothetical protein
MMTWTPKRPLLNCRLRIAKVPCLVDLEQDEGLLAEEGIHIVEARKDAIVKEKTKRQEGLSWRFIVCYL